MVLYKMGHFEIDHFEKEVTSEKFGAKIGHVIISNNLNEIRPLFLIVHEDLFVNTLFYI